MPNGIRIVIVDENDIVIGVKEREKVVSADFYRVSALWLTNSVGSILLAQRAFTKSHDPGKWGPAVAGTVEEGETYKSNIKKEAFEELGLKDVKIVAKGKIRNLGKERKHKYFSQWFSATINKKAEDFTISAEEVAQVKWFTPKELLLAVKTNPKDYLGIIHKWVKGEVKF